MNTTIQQWYGNELVQQNIYLWIKGREICWEIPHNSYTEWANRNIALIKNWLRVPEAHSIHASPTRYDFYDYVLDVDVPNLELSRKVELAILEVFAEYKIAPTLITFTSNRGFHNWFFQEMFHMFALDGHKYTPTTMELFYKVSTHLLRDLVAKKVGMERPPFQKFIEVKIARSMVRVPYCLHLGTNGVEIPVQLDQIPEIRKEDAHLEHIREVVPLELVVQEEIGIEWLDSVTEYYIKHKVRMDELYRKPDFAQIEGLGIYAGESVFPPCMFTLPTQGNRRKSAGFIANFLYYCNWTEEKINEYMQKWYATLEQKGIAKDGHKFYWNQIKKIIVHLDKNKLFLPGCAWLRENGLCRKDGTCTAMKKKHPRYYVLEKQKKRCDTGSRNEQVMLQFCANTTDDVKLENIRYCDLTVYK